MQYLNETEPPKTPWSIPTSTTTTNTTISKREIGINEEGGETFRYAPACFKREEGREMKMKKKFPLSSFLSAPDDHHHGPGS